MAAIAGKDGKLMFDVSASPTEVGLVTNWSLDISGETVDVSSLDEDWRVFIRTLQGWTGSCEVHWDVANETAQAAMITTNLIGGASAVTIQFYVNATNYYSGECFVTGASISTPVDGQVTASIEIQGTSTLSYT